MAPAHADHQLRLSFLVVVAGAAASALLLASPADAALPRVEHAPTKADGSLAILAVGDWGRRGQFNQTLVAQQVQ
jgi:tartrate-resistant acid phosphatase type 5